MGKRITPDLNYIIKGRFSLQSTQKLLGQAFDISIPFKDLNSFMLDPQTKCKFLSWDDNKKKQFILTLGGRVYFKQTQKMINSILKAN
jgi:hypothetical protein